MTAEVSAPVVSERGVPGFGMELQLDLAGCDPEVLASGDDLIVFVTLLAERIGMTTCGDPIAHNFGEGDVAGWTVIQLITTSNINLHATVEEVYLNVFSCRHFDTDAATEFAVGFFSAKAHTARTVERTAPTV